MVDFEEFKLFTLILGRLFMYYSLNWKLFFLVRREYLLVL